MGSHPANLAIRFLLELAALFSLGLLGWSRLDGPLRWVAALGLPLVAMALWGTFAVPGDPSRSGAAPIPTPGLLRLALELALFCGASLSLWASGLPRAAVVLALVSAVHYALSWDRIAWLLRH